MWLILEHGGRRLRLAAVRTAAGCWVATPGGAVWAGDAAVTAAPERAPRAAAEQRDARAPMTGRIVAVAAAPGATVAVGETLVVLEAMKMEYRLAAPRALVVAAVCCSVGQQVEVGAQLVTFA